MRQGEWDSLWKAVTDAGNHSRRWLWGAETSVALGELLRGSSLGGDLDELRGRSVVVATRDQITAALALIELDGIVRRLVVCPPNLPLEHLRSVMTTAQADAIVSDRAESEIGALEVDRFVKCSVRITFADLERAGDFRTEWVLLTSGTTGAPKLVSHSLSSLTGAIKQAAPSEVPVVWSTFYDIRRYGGLQIFLRAIYAGAAMVLSSPDESTADFLARAAAHGVTHISGTPSHWRRALMSPSARVIAPPYVRLSGEIADQGILDNLRAAYPEANIEHAFASTEAGVAFAVGDGLAGFPASLVGKQGVDVEIRIEAGSLRIRSARTASHYLGREGEILLDKDGFVDTGDIVERRGDHYYFVGRKGGIVNVGGLKVHPEEVEAVINRHTSVQMSIVRARKNPITGAVVVADVVVKSDRAGTAIEAEALKREILDACRSALPPHKVPAAIRIVPSLDVGASGKLARPNA
jgi:acyl-coenzyme A synthetase/AMP-(fatty) acid ligase